jgi:hypothetical protein
MPELWRLVKNRFFFIGAIFFLNEAEIDKLTIFLKILSIFVISE